MLLWLIQGLVYLWTIITLPIYFLIYRPWTKTRRFYRKRAHRVEILKDEVTYRALSQTSPLRQKLMDENVNTMDKIFAFAAMKYGSRNCLGARKILEERQIPGVNGKIFKKLVMEPKYRWMNYQQVDQKSFSIGRGLQLLGMKARDKLVMYCDTKSEWMMTAIGCFKFNFSLVTIYTNLGEDGVTYGINQTEANYVCTSQELLPKLLSILDKLPTVHTIIVVEEPWKGKLASLDTKFQGRKTLYSWEDVCNNGLKNPYTDVSRPNPDDIAILMYTSGSTGNPKAVMLTHQNLVNATLSICGFAENAIDRISADDCYIGYLPLAHVLELLAENVMLLLGVSIGYSNPNSLTDNSTLVMPGAKGDAPILRPTVMAAVPVVLDKIYKGIHSKLSASGEFKSKLVEFCIGYRAAWVRRGYDTPILNKLIFGNMRAIVGGRVKVLFSGGAPLAEEAHQFIRTALCLQLHQGYGLTETAASATITEADDISVGRVGTPLQGVDLKIVSWNEGGYSVTDNVGPRGEIHIGGGNVSAGYYNMPEKSEEDYYLENGKRWFKTGDIGQVMQDGTFKIIDRKKDLVKLQMGEYVSLGKVESILKIFHLIDNVCVYAKSSESFAVALIVPDEAKLTHFAAKIGLNEDCVEKICANPKVVKEFLKVLTSHGLANGLEKFEVPKKIHLVSELWTPDSGLVTAAMKLKRKEIEKRYSNQIIDMYSGPISTTAIDMNFNCRSGKVTPA